MTEATTLTGRRVLLVEDEFLLADDLVRAFRASGAEVVGPVASVARAMELVLGSNRIDGAVLDVNLRGELIYPVADALLHRSIPFVFTTGYDAGTIPPRFAEVDRYEKPINAEKIAGALFA